MLCLSTAAHSQEHAKESENKQKNKKESLQDIEVDPLLSDDYWIVSFHETISDSVYQSAAWFDKFFSEEDGVQATPKTNARIRLGWEPKSRDWNDIETRFRIKVKLPHFQNKVDVILSDDDETEQNQLPLESGNVHTNTDEQTFSAAVRYIHKQENDRITDSRIGISGGDIFIRARHKRQFAWNDSHGFKLEPSVFYFLDDRLGARLLLEYDYQFSLQSQFRINYSIRGSESFSGIRWKHGFYKLNQIGDSSASILGLQVQGERNGKRGFVIDKYTLSYRYRFNALKKWLFFEIEPFLEWPEDENYTTTPGIAFRVEGYFFKG